MQLFVNDGHLVLVETPPRCCLVMLLSYLIITCVIFVYVHKNFCESVSLFHWSLIKCFGEGVSINVVIDELWTNMQKKKKVHFNHY